MKNIFKYAFCGLMVVVTSFCVVACKKQEAKIQLPENINYNASYTQPKLKVYNTSTKQITEMELETYLLGVVAGEMFNSWHIEALKAQAVIARTYTLYYLQNFKSKYEGADISNDVTEAQAYDESRINDAVKQAVKETEGVILTNGGEMFEAWFHSNSGGTTTKAKNGLNFLGDENYTQVKKSVETAENSENFNWSKTFTKSEVLSALREMGISVTSITSFAIGEKDESGRALTFKIGSKEFNANTFRLKIGSTDMKSTLITDVVVSVNSINFTGLGYGHGVGMSQWGAKVLAEEGKSYEDILKFYFKNIKIAQYVPQK